ncbi:MAG: ABC transporter permease [Candidatus Parabeggiatoa sp.]|nr:ABC transporter permease [Candidatus Parabeggiatoa sp.]
MPSVKPHTQILPPNGWGEFPLRELWAYRELLWFLTIRDIKARYRQMALGPLWVLLNPIVHMIVFSVIFGGLAQLPSDGLPYPLFTYTALLPWNYFLGSANGSVGSLVHQLGLISKVYFPRLIIPISALFGGLIDLMIAFLVLIAMMIYYGIMPSWNIWVLPFYVLFASATALGISLWCAAIVVRFRDIKDIISYGLSILMYATPVAYSASLVPERWLWLYQLNPMYWVIEGWRWGLLGSGQAPQPFMLVSVVMVIILLISGIWIFHREERTIVDWL